MLQAEEKGLKILESAKAIRTPRIVGTATEGSYQFILLEFIEGLPSINYWRQLGEELAKLHQVTSEVAGLDHPNYIGSLPQINTSRKSWIDFFIINRLEAQLKLLSPTDKSLLRDFETLFKKLPELLVDEPHSLLHGDLWSGNLIATSTGEPCLIDPAVYFGNREAEISFTLLFGGFNDEFYDAYQAAFPLQRGFRERVSIYNLYPLLVHANLFGGSYLSQVKSILKKWS
jgi:fructosamine-3-kinase